MISHELRTPLNAIVGWSDMLRRGTLPESRRARAVEAIYDSAKRQGQLIEELLDVGRIMSGKLRLERTAVDLQDIVRGAVDVVQVSRQAKRIDVTVDIDASLGPLYADATRLQQVVWNLVSNAIKFTPEGAPITGTPRLNSWSPTPVKASRRRSWRPFLRHFSRRTDRARGGTAD
jgi:signal transduction histidine kinase